NSVNHFRGKRSKATAGKMKAEGQKKGYPMLKNVRSETAFCASVVWLSAARSQKIRILPSGGRGAGPHISAFAKMRMKLPAAIVHMVL
ncbi:hypothetical protein LC165_22985, partial [Escherichia coli]